MLSYSGKKKKRKCFSIPIFNVIFIITIASTTSFANPDLAKANTLASPNLSGVNIAYQAHTHKTNIRSNGGDGNCSAN